MRVALIEPGAVATAIWDKGEASVDELERRFSSGEGPEYAWLLDEARGFVAEGRRTGVPASRVADAVEHALTAPRPKARYLVGRDAKLAGHVIARLPDRAREALLRLETRRLQKVGAALRRDRTPTP